MQRMLRFIGAGIEEANDYSVSGCSECRMPNRDTFTSPCAYINFAAALEMTLYNGKMLKYGEEVIGLKTGEFEEFASFEEFLSAYLKQQKYFIRNAFIQEHEIIRLRAVHFASPFGSLLHKLCRDSYTDIHQPEIPGGIDLGYFEFIGYGTVIDSLSAIKKFVFEEKKITWQQLKQALHESWTGMTNKNITDNLRAVKRKFPKLDIIVRTPVIPGFNDNEADIRKICEFLKQIGQKKYELLEYHRFGKSKYQKLGRDYPMKDAALDDGIMEKLRSVAGEYGFV